MLERVSAAALRRVREHREAGHHTLLLTGAIRPITRPLAPLFDEIVAADLAVDARGLATGFLATPPLVGESRAAWLRRHAQLGGYDLSRVLRLRRQLLRPADACAPLACPPPSRRTSRCGARPARCAGRWSCGARPSRRPGATCRRGAGPGEQPMMLALEVYRSVPRYTAARALGGRMPGLLVGPMAPVRLVTTDEPRVRYPGWARVRPTLSGICGSDLGALSGIDRRCISPR